MKELYFAALVLPEELNTEIAVYKQRMLDDFGCRVALRSPAHITLLPPFRMDAAQESALVAALDDCLAGISPFMVSTNGFGSFRPRTIFIEPVMSDALAALKKQVDVFARNNTSFGAAADVRPFHPHITIATRDLSREAFAVAWTDWADQPFAREWRADGLSLLRMGQKKWEVINTSPFRL
ncbi:MAG: hypothetical protein JWP27_1692 [Flaviaesturariibacter sp.]|nr:hypothetical protein [Flaviaesturariibacter sp.]